MASTAKATPAVNPNIAAMFSNGGNGKKSFSDRVVDMFVSSVDDSTEVVGRIAESFSGDAFSDGQKAQRLLNAEKRAQRWSHIQQRHNLSDADLQFIINS